MNRLRLSTTHMQVGHACEGNTSLDLVTGTNLAGDDVRRAWKLKRSPIWWRWLDEKRRNPSLPWLDLDRWVRSLVTLDLSENHLTGEIPNWIEGYRAATEFRISKDLRVEGVDYTTKRGTYTYEGNILEYMSGIYLSCNRITVEIPLQFGNLSEILSLNLSHNNLTGHIPSTFSRLKQIESLDLSHNNLIGRIPIQLTELYTLEVFNVSYNNLSGSIPSKKAQFGTFDESSYEVNPFLCRPPLHKSCDRPDSPPTPNASDDDDEENGLMDVYVFWVTFSVAYAIVLLVIAAILYINPYWRRAWFYLLNAASGLASIL
ncbi:hypothetical protein F3Y22_tig00117048pilonHSYRG00464 [Hibiscus syriacus]|uniref:Uncharacterized protein n=1 Tax=Hibiscus syriacus TaxID=106335 RepID=A0A6A2WLZ1_HIBSY|nr:hypothetical protein F3Y22_tig00117048pilonHSYRG00464 [Hibiscus syriacus]